jgi:hypothetical protein
MSEQEKILTLDTITGLQAQLNAANAQGERLLKVVQEIAQVVGVEQGTNLEDLASLVKAKIEKTDA